MATFMQQAAFRPLQLPSSIAVPVGAIDHSSEPGGLCSRSLHMTPLKQQVVSLLETKVIIDAELSEASADVTYVSGCMQIGLLSEGMYHRYHDEHPAHLAGLAEAGDTILQSSNAMLMDAVGAYLSAKQSTLLLLRARLGESVYVPRFFTEHDFITDCAAAVQLLAP